MEDLSKSHSIISNNLALTMPVTVADGSSIPARPTTKKKKNNNGGAFSFFKAALFKLRQRNNEKPPNTEADKKEAGGPKDKWKKFVGSMRPLHLQENQSPRASSTTVDSLDYLIPPASPAHSYSTATSGGTMSQYASANNLQELDKHEENDEEEQQQQKREDPDEVFDAIPADDMIDVKAEEFIAHFYKEMKMQRFDTANSLSHLGKKKV